jgi:uncharacterized protein (DUF302 family)
MNSVNIKKELALTMDQAIAKVTQALQAEGFGVLTRIDFHTKIKEKLDKSIKPLVILGACDPHLAYGAFQRNPDITSLIPCNAVVREIDNGRVSVELAKPTAMMSALGDQELVALAAEADRRLQKALESL